MCGFVGSDCSSRTEVLRPAPHLTDPDGGGAGHSQGTGEVAVLDACVRSVPAKVSGARSFHRTSGIDDSCSCWTRSQKKGLSAHRDTNDIQRPPRHEGNANPKVRLSPRCRIIPSETHNASLAGSKLRLFLVAQRANSVRNNELEQSTRVTEDSGDVLQYQGQRKTSSTPELSLEENVSSWRRCEGRDWH